MQRWDIINDLINKNNYKSYLEIGYYKGWSFDQVKCYDKTAVDPNPSKTTYQETLPYGKIDEEWSMDEAGVAALNYSYKVIKLTSDDFFSKSKKTYDIIFIDGLHESEQVYKDIINSLKVLNPGGTIVMHDCNPPKYEHTTSGIDGCWTGDTYKALIQFRILHPHNVFTVDTDWGVGIIGDKIDGLVYSPFPRVPEWEEFDKNRKEYLNLITVEEFINQ